MTLHLELYSTAGCHLCEQAEHLIVHLLSPEYFSLDVVEISESDELMAAYGVRIPVLKRMDTGAELGWPFQASDLIEFLQTPA